MNTSSYGRNIALACGCPLKAGGSPVCLPSFYAIFLNKRNPENIFRNPSEGNIENPGKLRLTPTQSLNFKWTQ